MGIWGEGIFENDDAMDFLMIVEKEDALDLLHSAFSKVTEISDYIEVDSGANALAAAEIVAVIRGHKGENLPELYELWSENPTMLLSWQTNVEDLLKRLRAALA